MPDPRAPIRWPGLSPFGAMREMRRDLLAVAVRAGALGEVVDVRVPSARLLLVSSPRVIEQVLVIQPKNFSRNTRIYKQLRRVLGNGLLTSDGSFWLRQRRLVQPAFHRERLQLLSGLMARAAREMVASWQQKVQRGEAFDVEHEFQAVTMRIVAESLLSVDVNRDEAFSSALQAGFEATRHGLTHRFALPRWVPTRANRMTEQSRETLHRVLFDLIARRRESDTANDLLSMFLSTVDADTGERMTDAQLFDEVMTMFIAGHETTTALLTWAVFLLSERPDVAQALRDELKSVLEGREPALADLPKLALLNRVFAETMRLYPPAWLVTRRVIDDCVLDGWRVEKNATLLMSPYVVHRLPTVFDDPGTFNPDRWLEGRSPPRGGYLPFGMGGHKCIGDHFAQLEFTVVLAAVLTQVDLAVVSPPVPQALVTLRPRERMRVVASALAG